MPDLSASHARAGAPPKESVKETLISIIIAFALAFVFRSFVIEAFIIPTGSMAPTLMGAHMRFESARTGADWAVAPWTFRNNNQETPFALQNGPGGAPIEVNDPLTGEAISASNVPSKAGDRILVLKYLYALRSPARFDVIVFKNPTDPAQNYIKRLVGLPGEQVALVDGDVFTRAPEGDGAPAPAGSGVNLWAREGWRIARKHPATAEAVWQDVFDTASLPSETWVNPAAGGARAAGLAPFSLPWALGPGWGLEPRGVLRYTGTGATALRWNAEASWLTSRTLGQIPRAVVDRYPYNQAYQEPRLLYPVADLRLRAGVVVPPGATVRARLDVRGHQFVGELGGGKAVVKMRPAPTALDGSPAWTVLAEAPLALPADGRAHDIDFQHVDQSLRLTVDGRAVVRGEYDWGPAERLRHATGIALDELLAHTARTGGSNPLADPGIYRQASAQVRLEFEGGPVEVRRLVLQRDLHYQPAFYGENGRPALATHPDSTLVLGPDQFFVCGDNSPSSLDGRLLGKPTAWVDRLMDERGMDVRQGVVARDLLLGKAFFVYFPATAGRGGLWWVPDFGRMRFIR